MLTKTKLNTIDRWISKALNDLGSSHEEFLSANTALKEYNDMKGATKFLRILTQTIFKYADIRIEMVYKCCQIVNKVDLFWMSKFY